MDYQDQGSRAALSCSYPNAEQALLKNYATIGHIRTQSLLINETESNMNGQIGLKAQKS